MSKRRSAATPNVSRWPSCAACLVGACSLTAFSLQSVLGSSATASQFLSGTAHVRLVQALCGHVEQPQAGMIVADVDFTPLLGVVSFAALACWLAGGAWISRRTEMSFGDSLGVWGVRGWLWWFLPGAWEMLRIFSFSAHVDGLAGFILGTASLWYAASLAGWAATFFSLSQRTQSGPLPKSLDANQSHTFGVPAAVWLMVSVYVVVFTGMNWQLYEGLLVPHGDSAMYEEHLWNLTHGKGFRSYLDQGLFLGEHIQVVHLLLLPIYLVWPTHPTLELCESMALASGALPVFWMARRHTGSRTAGALLAATYLCYFPMQYLDIEIDLKTFRPITFGAMAMLFALDQLERGRYRSMLLLLLVALSAKEDYAIIIAPLGVWIALRQTSAGRQLASTRPHTPGGRVSKSGESADEEPSTDNSARKRLLGGSMAVGATAYLFLVVKYVIPSFRDGETVHYVRYFSKLGGSVNEIIQTIFTNPGVLFGELLTIDTLLYALLIVLPLGALPLLSSGRLAVGLPLFGLLCLNEIANDPRHHFHAPLVPIVLWAAAAGMGVWSRRCTRIDSADSRTNQRSTSAVNEPPIPWLFYFSWTSAVATGLFFGLGPLSRPFWDSGSRLYWENLYVPGERAEQFPRVFEKIPQASRVASTDFVHPRFTHHERSYDYSNYPRKVNENKTGAPPDTQYIVIDTGHHYSEIRTPDEIREYREHPEQWELLPDESNGLFIVLKRKTRETIREDNVQEG